VEEIKKLKDVGLIAENPNVKKKTIDALAAYGNQAIDSIVAIVAIAVNPEVKEHGLDAIKRIKEEKDGGNG
jgi:hypothetical protein